jgi:arylsulfatase A-like enzyme
MYKIASIILILSSFLQAQPVEKNNILFIMTDQWRAQATGYMGDPNVKTPAIDKFALESLNFVNAISGMPVCCPFRATMMTGQRPLTHGVFMNDVQLNPEARTIGKVLKENGYDTAYIGKWHIDGRGRSSYIPPERRQGFDYFKVLECTHNYNNSQFYDNNNTEITKWPGYDAIEQTTDGISYLKEKANSDKPFALFMSYGTPHAPYHTAPQKYRDMYKPENMILHPNVPKSMEKKVRKDLAGYYAHCTALDDIMARLTKTLAELKLEDNTIVVFTADHGDLLGSHGSYKKQQPFEESARVPMLWKVPGVKAAALKAPINSEDLMPTLLQLVDIDIPNTVEGISYSDYINGGKNPSDGIALITCVQPFGQWNRKKGGREFRAVRTPRYTYARSLEGDWLLFDNEKDPYQQKNLVQSPEHKSVLKKMNVILDQKLKASNDEFKEGHFYIEKWGYKVDQTGTVPYSH